jgi:hypothetical protein
MVFWRSGLAFLDEGRLKFELQQVLTRQSGAWDYLPGTGLTFQLNADLAARAMVIYDSLRRDARFVLQLYFYKRV